MSKLLGSGILSASLGLSLFASSAFAQMTIRTVDETQNRMNIDVPTTDVKPEEVESLINALDSFVVEGKSEVALTDALAKVVIAPQFEGLVAQIMATREPTAQVECLGRKCKILSLGEAANFKVEGVKLPVIGTPSISLSKDITFVLQLSEDKQRAEICRITGIAVKAGFLKPAVEGGLLEMNAGVIKTLRVDAGSGGDYPSAACDFVSPPEGADKPTANVSVLGH